MVVGLHKSTSQPMKAHESQDLQIRMAASECSTKHLCDDQLDELHAHGLL